MEQPSSLFDEIRKSVDKRITNKGLGDVIANNPVVHRVGLLTGCVDPTTNQLQPKSRCHKWKTDLNHLSDSFYDVFWPKPKQKDQ